MGENNDDYSLFFTPLQKSLISNLWDLLSFFSGDYHSFSSNSIDETDKNSYNKVNW